MNKDDKDSNIIVLDVFAEPKCRAADEVACPLIAEYNAHIGM
jgi:hypothetical protein